jgi:hypothetical protein
MTSRGKRRYRRLTAIERLAIQLAFVDDGNERISEERIAACFNVCRLTVRSAAIEQGLHRGDLATQMGRIRQLYEWLTGNPETETSWAGIVERARALVEQRLNALARRDQPIAA